MTEQMYYERGYLICCRCGNESFINDREARSFKEGEQQDRFFCDFCEKWAYLNLPKAE